MTEFQSAHILVVEDDPTISEMLITLLELEGYAVCHVPDGQSIKRVLAQTSVPLEPPCDIIDAIILDLQLGDIDGADAILQLQESGVNIPPVIVMSAKRTQTIEAAADKINATAVVNKPFDIAVLLATVNDVLKAQPS